MSYIARWLYAAKPNSWPKLLVPTLLGTGIGADAVKHLGWSALGISLLFTCCLLLFIVFLNDWADQDVDRIKRSMFPDGCSPKTIPDGILSSKALLFAGSLAGILAVLTGYVGGRWLGRPWMGVASIVCLGIFVAYTLPPIRLNYRGHGELLEMVGTGIALPLWSLYAQSGKFWASHLVWCLPGWCLLCLASALASGLSDEKSDKAGHKNTYTTRFGNLMVRRWIYHTASFGVGFWLVLPVLFREFGRDSHIPILPWLVIVALTMSFVEETKKYTEQATTNAFQAIGKYKGQLHKAIWFGGGALGILWIITSFS
ncbi:MAG: prenyltransferase [Myxococcales bacterium]|nr:prenyltransferase [Myxococcales bacterium]